MENHLSLSDISIRTELKPGDIGYLTYMHGDLYRREYDYQIPFEAYVAKGLCEFYQLYDPQRCRIWVCEHQGRIIGSLLVMDRGQAAQLRYFLIDPAYRGIKLGSRLMQLCMQFIRDCGYPQAYLWTTHELAGAAFLYKKAGFQLTEEKESTSFGKWLKEQRYDWFLSGQADSGGAQRSG
jgi:peptidyl-dipeptidase Dcp